jgi:hypothetical protein
VWIESHPELGNHPKLPKLCELLGIKKREAIGLLHELWWWCTAYAEDGDLRRHGMAGVNRVMGLSCDDMSLLRSGFLDYRPYLRVHDWWDYYGRYLKLKYRNNPKELIRIENLCAQKTNTRKSHALATQKLRRSEDTDVTDVTDVPELNGRTDVPAKSKATDSLTHNSKATSGHVQDCTCEVCWKAVAVRSI